MELSSEYFQLPSLRVHALVAGPKTGTPVVLLHGFPELAESWRDVLAALAQEGYRAVAPDLRGYGQTESPETGYDMGTLSADVAALLRAVGGRAHLIGHDWGGAIAYDVAAHYPEHVQTLTVLNAPHPVVMSRRMWSPRQLRKSWYMFFFQLPFIPERWISAGGGKRIASLLRREAKGSAHLPAERLARYAEAFSTPERAHFPVQYYREAVRAALRPSYWTRARSYPRIRAPFRLIWGTEDLALGRHLSMNMDHHFERPVEVKYLEGVGHFGHLEAPEQVAPLMIEHLRAHA